MHFRRHEGHDAKIVSDRPDRRGVERFRTYSERRPLPGRRWSPIVAYVETKADVSEEVRRYHGRLEAIDNFGKAIVGMGMGATALPFVIEYAVAVKLGWLSPTVGAGLDLGAQLIRNRGKEIDWISVIVAGLTSGLGNIAFGSLAKLPTLTGFGWRGGSRICE